MKKSISNSIHLLITLILLCGTSSFSLERGDSLKFSNDDKITVVKISMPSRQMLRKGDLEMHRNMYVAVKNFGRIAFTKSTFKMADETINANFYSNYMLQVPVSDAADHEINAWFHATQMYPVHTSSLLEADVDINNSFSQEN